MAGRVLEHSADIAISVDSAGIIRAVFLGEAFRNDSVDDWVGRSWVETVAGESRKQVEELLAEMASVGASRTRQVNQTFSSGRKAPVAYTGLHLQPKGHYLLIGRNLQALADLQQNLVAAQQAMERDYWRLRQVETRFRLLFHRSAEPVLVADAISLQVMDANPAAAQAFGSEADRLVDTSLLGLLPVEVEPTISQHLAEVRAGNRPGALSVKLGPTGTRWRMEISLVRQDPNTLFLIHLRAPSDVGVGETVGHDSLIQDLLADAPDGFVVTDLDGQVLQANRAFLSMAQVPTLQDLRVRSLPEWLGRPGADWTVLRKALEGHGVVRLFQTTLQGALGDEVEVELSAVAALDRDPPLVALVLRDVGRRLGESRGGIQDLSSAVEELSGLVGRVSLKDLVRETVALVERHFLESALALTGDNRTAAAELLGLSRQSLYTKLRRYGVGGRDGLKLPE